LEGRRDQRSPLRRCFKPRPPLSAGCAGFASGCRLSGSELKRPMISPLGLESLGFDPRPHSGRLSGLLSGCPPTGTRPQARAKLGNRELISMHHRCKSFFALAQNFLVAGSRNGYAAVAIARREPRVRCLDAPRYRTLLPLVEVRGCAQRARASAVKNRAPAARRLAVAPTRCVNAGGVAMADCAGRKWPRSSISDMPRALAADTGSQISSSWERGERPCLRVKQTGGRWRRARPPGRRLLRRFSPAPA
jgi:hypothetical protein